MTDTAKENIRSRMQELLDAVWRWMKGVVGVRNDRYDQIRLFAASLSSDLSQLEEAQVEPPPSADALSDIRKQLNEATKNLTSKDAWPRMYAVEKSISALFSPERTWLELRRRVAEAVRVNAPFVGHYQSIIPASSVDTDTSSLSDPQACLQMLLSDLHWHYNRQYIKRRYARYAIYRVSIMFVATFILLICTLVWAYAGKDTGVEEGATSEPTSHLHEFRGDKQHANG